LLHNLKPEDENPFRCEFIPKEVEENPFGVFIACNRRIEPIP
jgi:hypothetical protein